MKKILCPKCGYEFDKDKGNKCPRCSTIVIDCGGCSGNCLKCNVNKA